MTTGTVETAGRPGRTDATACARIRPAQAHDIPALLAMIRALAAHEGCERYVRTDAEALHRDGFGAHPRFGAFLAELDGRAVGFVSYTVNYSIWAAGDMLAIDDLYVDAGVRGSGIGVRLMLPSPPSASTKVTCSRAGRWSFRTRRRVRSTNGSAPRATRKRSARGCPSACRPRRTAEATGARPRAPRRDVVCRRRVLDRTRR